MIPGGDHSTRSLLHRRVSSWAEAVSVNSPVSDELYSILSSSSEQDDDDHDHNQDELLDLSQPLLPALEYEEESNLDDESIRTQRRKNKIRLWFVFVVMVVSGVGQVVLAKLQSVTMYNYPTLLNLYANVMYILVSFSYILPVAYFGWFHRTIPRRHLRVSKKPFLVMGFLDALSSTLQVLASIYLPGTLLVLLPQAAIPLSMVASKVILRERFTKRQIVGATIVFLGILVVLTPVLTHHKYPEFTCQPIEEANCAICKTETSEDDCLSHIVSQQYEYMFDSIFSSTTTTATDRSSNNYNYNLYENNNNNNYYYADNGGSNDDDNVINYCLWISREERLRKDDLLVFVWSLLMVGSCVPMVFSSIYKQVALQVQLDPILVNGWVSLFQFAFGLPLAIPAALVSSPKVKPWEIPKNWANGMGCLFSNKNSVGSGCHPDDCTKATLYVHLFLLCSVIFTLSMMFVLKYGSSSLLYLGLTLMVPLGHLVFSLHSPSSIGIFDILGLIVLVSGLVLYRFGNNELQQQLATRNSTIPSSPQGAGIATGEGNETTGGENPNADEDQTDGFLEFLREPFMLMGDI